MTSASKNIKYFVNLHCAWDLSFIQVDDRGYNFDRSGRLLWIGLADKVIERNMNNVYVEKSNLGFDSIYKDSKILDANTIEKEYQKMVDDIGNLKILLDINPTSQNLCVLNKKNDEAKVFIKKILSHNYHRDGNEYERAYNPVEIFPSDLVYPLVIQATYGCAYNKCTFCEFYKGKPYREKELGEFKEHVEKVKSFLGDSIKNKTCIFLGDASALAIDQEKLVRIFEILNDEFIENENYKIDGVYSFIEALFASKKSVADFKQLKELGLKKVYIGLESGSDQVLSFVNKCNTADEIVELILRVKSAKIAVGVMVIAGLGGDKYNSEHIEKTIEVLNRLDLGKDDSINFSHLVIDPNSQYKIDSDRDGINPFDYEQERKQIEQIVKGLRFRDWRPNVRGYEVKNIRY